MRKRPKQVRSRALVEALVEATARVLAEEGRARLTTNRVAEVAGVSVGSLYQYFADKEALVAEVGRRYAEAFGARLARFGARVVRLPLREAVIEAVALLVEIHAEDPHLHNELGAELPEEDRSPAVAMVARYLEEHAAEIRRPDPLLAARIAMQTGEALVHETALRTPELLHDPAFVAEIADLLVRYLVRDEAAAASREPS